MSEKITQDMKASGVAQVIVLLKSNTDRSASSVRTNLENHFTRSEYSITNAVASAKDELKASDAPKMRYYPHLGIALGTVDRQGLAALRSDKQNVEKVIGAPPLRPIRPRLVAAASLTQTLTWGIKSLGIKELWDQGLTGKDVLVGHLDTGVDGKHAALKDAIFDFTQFDDFGREVKPKPKPFDSDDHGTHTAATIAGRPVGGKHVGVAPKSKLASAMVIEGGNAVARVLGGMDWAVGKGIRILSMSLGFPGYWTDFLDLTRIIRARGILPVFAVGNEFAASSRSPGNYPQALSVGAATESMEVADFSSSQLFKRKTEPLVPDLIAPGDEVISAKPGGGYQLMSGTSMATPHIAGLAALLWEAKPDATVNQIEKAIFESCQLKPKMARMRANRGFPDAKKALSLL